MITDQTLEDRLATALRLVAAHGIAVRRTTGDPAGGAHAAMIRAELAARFPAGTGSYVLWAAVGEAYALQTSDTQTAEAVAAACQAAGMDTCRAGALVTAWPHPAEPVAAPVPALPAWREASPWRWLEARAA
jgi:hypothetical protein